uniref:Hsp90 co-chaperone Cdc37 n=1 Tax=Bos taurus TaxID=9913 RepID=Q58D03_BOVIN|nr:CDC37 homolog [Bos taurus]
MVDYSVWDHIEVSDDEDETHPNIDTASLFRWRHQARVERMEQFQKEKEELDRGCRECKRKVAECQRKLKELEVAEGEGGKAELERLQAEAQQLRKEERSWEQKLEEMRKKEKSMPWNVDTLSKDGFSKSMVNTKPEQAEEESEEVREQKHKTFVEKYEKQIKHFGMLRRWDDSQKYLSDNVHLVCEETANYLVIWCIDLEVEENAPSWSRWLTRPSSCSSSWSWPRASRWTPVPASGSSSPRSRLPTASTWRASMTNWRLSKTACGAVPSCALRRL